MEVFTWNRKLTKLTVVPVLVAIIVSVLLGVSIKFGELTVADMWRRWAPAAIDPAFNSWCLPARIRMEFSGHWKGLTLWGHLPVDGKVHGEAHVIRNASASLIYFRYGVAPDVIQEQWSVWREGGRHVTIGRNTTVAAGPLGLLDGAAESACFTLEDAPATASNDPSFCRKTNEVQFQFSRYGGCGGSEVAQMAAGVAAWWRTSLTRCRQSTHLRAVPFGSEQLEEWSIRRVRRMPNSTLSILFKRLPADNPEPFESSRGASVSAVLGVLKPWSSTRPWCRRCERDHTAFTHSCRCCCRSGTSMATQRTATTSTTQSTT